MSPELHNRGFSSPSPCSGPLVVFPCPSGRKARIILLTRSCKQHLSPSALPPRLPNVLEVTLDSSQVKASCRGLCWRCRSFAALVQSHSHEAAALGFSFQKWRQAQDVAQLPGHEQCRGSVQVACAF